jgi:peptidoglycan/LPS O-acetylase OafA/YrhL
LSPPPLPPRPNAAPAGPTNRSWTDCARWPSWACFATTVGALAFSCPLVARWLRYFPQTNPWIATIEIWEAVFIGWMIAATAQGWTGWPGRFLSWPPLVYIGKISLGVYLYHVLVPITLGPSLDRAGITAAAPNTLRVWLLAGLSIGVAALSSWQLLEKPLAKFKPRLSRGRRALSSPSPPPGGTARRCVAPGS